MSSFVHDRQYKNFVSVDVSSTFTAGATSLTLATGHGARLPAIPFVGTMYDTSYANAAEASYAGYAEFINVTAYTGDTITNMTRGVEGSVAFASQVGRSYRIIVDATAGMVENIPRYLNPRSFGAKGDGVTNDTAAVVAAYNEAAANGGTLFFSRGTYLLTQNSLIVTQSKFTILGEAGAILKGVAGAGATSVLVRIQGTTATPISDIVIRNIEMDGQMTTASLGGAGSQAHLINLVNCKRVLVENCYLHDSPGDAVRIEKDSLSTLVTELVVKNNIIERCLRNGISAATCERVIITGNIVKEFSTVGIDVEPNIAGDTTRYIEISNNFVTPIAVFPPNATNSNRLYGIAVQTPTTAAFGSDTTTQVIINTNTVVGLLDGSTQKPAAGIFIKNWRNVSVKGNTITECSDGISSGSDSSNDGSVATVQGNFVRLCKNNGIGVRSHMSITGNICLENGGAGIWVFRTRNLISNNICRRNGTNTSATFRYGIYLGGDSNKCMGNLIIDDAGSPTQQRGIYLEDGVVDNEVRYNTLNGNVHADQIRLPASSNPFISDNIGFATEGTGSSTITNGNSNVVVTHGLKITPAVHTIQLTFTNTPTTAPGHIWISGISSTEFTVNCTNAQGATGTAFTWSIYNRLA